MPLLSDVVVFLSWIVVLTAKGQFLDCATIAISQRYVGIREPLGGKKQKHKDYAIVVISLLVSGCDWLWH